MNTYESLVCPTIVLYVPMFCYMFVYAHMLIVVAFLVVKSFSFLVITRNPTMRFGPKLEEIFLSASRSFLYLSGTFLKAINPSLLTPMFSEKIENFNDYLHFSVVHNALSTEGGFLAITRDTGH